MKDWFLRKQFSVPQWALKYPKTYFVLCMLSVTAAWGTVVTQWVKNYRDMTWGKRNLVSDEEIKAFSEGWAET